MAILNHRIGAIVIALIIIFLSFSSPSFAEKLPSSRNIPIRQSDFDSKMSSRTIAFGTGQETPPGGSRHLSYFRDGSQGFPVDERQKSRP